MFDIDQFALGTCEACIENSNQTKICLSCMKILVYEAIKDGTYHGIFDINVMFPGTYQKQEIEDE